MMIVATPAPGNAPRQDDPGRLTVVADADGVTDILVGGAGTCVITAGRQEYEGESGAAGIPSESRDLKLYGRAEALFDQHPALRDAHSELQTRIREAERYHRLRLESAMQAARALWAESGDSSTLREHRAQAISHLRTLDRQHVRQLRSVREGFRTALGHSIRAAISAARSEIVDELASASTVLIGGGHATVLLNRLLMFDLGPELAERNVVAWGAGAMVCTERVLLFDDRGPLGSRVPQFLGSGLGIIRGVVILPDARNRLSLSDTARLSILARRLSPSTALFLEPGGRTTFLAGRLQAHQGMHRLTASGRIARARQR